MATVLEALKSISGYPVPPLTLQNIAVERGVDTSKEVSAEELRSKEYRLAKADLLMWLANAPNINEGGVSFDMLYSDRERMREQANAIYKEYDDAEYKGSSTPTFGYKGDRL